MSYRRFNTVSARTRSLRRPSFGARRGSTAVMVATSFVMLAGFAAMAVDLGYTRAVDAQLEVAADSGAAGGAGFLDGTAAGVTKAYDAAVFYAASNTAYGQRVDLAPNPSNAVTGDIVMGHLDVASMTFQPTTDPALANSIMVKAKQTAISSSFARVAFGRDTLQAGACSVAYEPGGRGAQSVPYHLPLAVPDCAFDSYLGDDSDSNYDSNYDSNDDEDSTGDDDKELNVHLHDRGARGVRWASVDGATDSDSLSEAIDSALPCMAEWASTGRVSDDCNATAVGATARVSNLTQSHAVGHAAAAMHDGVEWDHERWGDEPERSDDSDVDSSDYGRVLAGPVLVYAAPAGYCTDAIEHDCADEPDVDDSDSDDHHSDSHARSDSSGCDSDDSDSDSSCAETDGSDDDQNSDEVRVVGFAWGVVYDASEDDTDDDSDSNADSVDDVDVDSDSDDELKVEVDLDTIYELGGELGGDSFGVQTARPAKALPCRSVTIVGG